MATKKSVIIPGIYGNALEWYDFTTYAFFVPVISQLFFPTKTGFLSLLIAFGVFATSFLIRPIGGVIFGYFGDRYGRKKALIASIITMSVPTFLFGLLPTHATVGLAAPILLTILRLFQGFAVSGEFTTTMSFLIEHAPENKRGFMGSLAMCSALVGIVLSSAVSTLIIELVDHDSLMAWGWRFPFWVAGLLGIIGLILRLKTVETQRFQAVHHLNESKTYFLLQDLMQNHYKQLFLVIVITCVMAVGNYFQIGYFVTFLSHTQSLPLKAVMITNLISLVVLSLLLPVFGLISDRIGRKPVLFFGIIGMVIAAHPSFSLLAQNSIQSALLGQLLFVFFLAAIAALIPTTVAELFPTHIRNSGMSIGYNISLALFGGTAPLIAIALVQETGNKIAPAWYIMICGIVSAIALLFVKETYKKPLL